MSDEASYKLSSRWYVAVSTVALLLLVGGVVFVTCHSFQGAEEVAQAFFVAVREDRLEDAHAMTTGQLQTYLVKDLPPSLQGTDQGRTLSMIHAAQEIELSLVTSGYKDGFVPFACLGGDLYHKPLRIVLIKVEGEWRVVDLHTEESLKACQSD